MPTLTFVSPAGAADRCRPCGAHRALCGLVPRAHALGYSLSPRWGWDVQAATTNVKRHELIAHMRRNRCVPYVRRTITVPMTLSNADPWRPFRAYRRRALIALALWLPITVVAAFTSVFLFGTESPANVVFFGFPAFIFWQGFRAGSLKCPRCGKLFSNRTQGNLRKRSDFGTGDHCMHCGLARYEPLSRIENSESTPP
jgi:hypothetical protein